MDKLLAINEKIYINFHDIHVYELLYRQLKGKTYI